MSAFVLRYRQFHALYVDIHEVEKRVKDSKGAMAMPNLFTGLPSLAYFKVAGKGATESKQAFGKE